MASEADLDSALATLRSQSYTYDVEGKLCSTSDTERGNGGDPTTTPYDNVGQLIKQVEPVTGTQTITTSFGYDAPVTRPATPTARQLDVHEVNSLGLTES